MTGLKNFNRESFAIAERALKAQGHEVRNPACLGTDWSKYQDYIEVGLVMLRQCEAICFLPGSEHSKGATIEREEAEKHALENVTILLAGNPAVSSELSAAYLIAKGVAK
jgi:hypothetical protein